MLYSTDHRAPTTFKLEGEVGDHREKWGDFWEKLIAINRNIVSRPRLVPIGPVASEELIKM
jgi:hypothetical protein